MKSLIIAALAVSAAAVAAPASAQWIMPPQGYVNLGYTYLNPGDRDLGEFTMRAGLRLSPWWGVEGELGTGVAQNRYTAGNGNHVKLSDGVAPAVYAVGYIPIGHYVPVIGDKLDVLARVGYGETTLKLETPQTTFINTSHSINYGGGLQYTMNGHDGLRFDYTRRDFQERTAPRDDDTYALAYVHKF